MSSPPDITELLVAWGEGDKTALDELAPLVECELHRLARNYMQKERSDHTLQTTALVNEAFVRLIDQKQVRWQNRAHFFAIAAKIMRRILLNYARDRLRFKRGGGAAELSLSEAVLLTRERSSELLALNEALERLTVMDERKSQVVELRYFGGLSIEETAEALGVAPVTVSRDWNLAKAWLAREIGNAPLL